MDLHIHSVNKVLVCRSSWLTSASPEGRTGAGVSVSGEKIGFAWSAPELLAVLKLWHILCNLQLGAGMVCWAGLVFELSLEVFLSSPKGCVCCGSDVCPCREKYQNGSLQLFRRQLNRHRHLCICYHYQLLSGL